MDFGSKRRFSAARELYEDAGKGQLCMHLRAHLLLWFLMGGAKIDDADADANERDEM